MKDNPITNPRLPLAVLGPVAAIVLALSFLLPRTGLFLPPEATVFLRSLGLVMVGACLGEALRRLAIDRAPQEAAPYLVEAHDERNQSLRQIASAQTLKLVSFGHLVILLTFFLAKAPAFVLILQLLFFLFTEVTYGLFWRRLSRHM